MSADSFYARTEKEMKRRVNVYDFDDFVECIKTAGADVIVPSYGDFRCIVGEDSKAKLAKPGRPKLADVSVRNSDEEAGWCTTKLIILILNSESLTICSQSTNSIPFLPAAPNPVGYQRTRNLA